MRRGTNTPSSFAKLQFTGRKLGNARPRLFAVRKENHNWNIWQTWRARHRLAQVRAVASPENNSNGKTSAKCSFCRQVLGMSLHWRNFILHFRTRITAARAGNHKEKKNRYNYFHMLPYSLSTESKDGIYSGEKFPWKKKRERNNTREEERKDWSTCPNNITSFTHQTFRCHHRQKDMATVYKQFFSFK